MVDKVFQKPVIPVNPQEIAQKVAKEGLKGAIDKAISASGDEYRTSYKKLLESKGFTKTGIARFKHSETDVAKFLDEIYQSLPNIFKGMIDKAVDEQTNINKLTQEHKNELRRELANVIDQELRLKGKFT